MVVSTAAACMKSRQLGQRFQQGRFSSRIFADQDCDRLREGQSKIQRPEKSAA